MKSAHEILKDAKALIADPKDWCQGRATTSDGAGGQTAPYCSVGAVGKAAGLFEEEEVFLPRQRRVVEAERALNAVTNGSIIYFNDRRDQSHACVMAAFDAAIERTTPPK